MLQHSPSPYTVARWCSCARWCSRARFSDCSRARSLAPSLARTIAITRSRALVLSSLQMRRSRIRRALAAREALVLIAVGGFPANPSSPQMVDNAGPAGSNRYAHPHRRPHYAGGRRQQEWPICRSWASNTKTSTQLLMKLLKSLTTAGIQQSTLPRNSPPSLPQPAQSSGGATPKTPNFSSPTPASSDGPTVA